MNFELFHQILSDLPRQGPGSFESTKRAYEAIPSIKSPSILDIGCGSGKQTIDLARLSPKATIVAVDIHPPFVEEVRKRAEATGCDDRIEALTGDMGSLPVSGQYDILWSEGAIFCIGVENALSTWIDFLKPGGFLAFTEAVWFRKDIPEEIGNFWARVYPDITDIESMLETIRRAGLQPFAHYSSPSSDWWADYYTPILKNLARYRIEMKDNPEAMQIIRDMDEEIEMFQKYSDFYGYEFFIAKK